MHGTMNIKYSTVQNIIMNEYTKISNSVEIKVPPTVRTRYLLQIYAVRRCLMTGEKFTFIKRKRKK